MIVQGTTQVFAIRGDPVAHSLSPKMHNAALNTLGLAAIYVPFHDVTPDYLPAAIAGEAFLLWTGTSPPAGVMKEALSF